MPRIAWIEDDIDVIDGVVRPLERAGYTVEKYRSISDAEQNLDRILTPDLLLLDMILPSPADVRQSDRYPGKNLLLRWQASGHSLPPVVIFTVVTNPSLMKELESLGVIDVISKPVRPSELKTRVDLALAAQRGGRSPTKSELKPKGSGQSKRESGAIDLFFVYSHKDEKHRREIEKHLSVLKSQGLINAWHDRMIPVGSDWHHQISTHLDKASIVLFLVSADFLASDYINGVEMKRALELAAQGCAVVAPIILRSCDWSAGPLGKFQALPRDARPVTQWPNRDDAYTDITKRLRQLVGELHPRLGQ